MTTPQHDPNYLTQQDAELIYVVAQRLRALKEGETMSAEDIQEFSYYSGFLYGILIARGFATAEESVTRGTSESPNTV